jgi:hypothetical protein
VAKKKLNRTAKQKGWRFVARTLARAGIPHSQMHRLWLWSALPALRSAHAALDSWPGLAAGAGTRALRVLGRMPDPDLQNGTGDAEGGLSPGGIAPREHVKCSTADASRTCRHARSSAAAIGWPVKPIRKPRKPVRVAVAGSSRPTAFAS